MSVFDYLEKAMRGIMQTPFKGLPSQVQEQEILDALRKQMDDHVRQERGRQEAPTDYLVRINPQDFQRLSGQRRDVNELIALRQRLGLSESQVSVEQLADLVTRVKLELRAIANSQGYLLTSALRITFQAEPKFARGRFDVRVVTGGGPQPGAAEVDHTNTMLAAPVGPGVAGALAAAAPTPAAGAPFTPSMPPAWLTLIAPSQGQPFRLDRTLIKLGRGDGNDIVLNEKRISRSHAEVRFDHGVYSIHDLFSQNGVFVNNVKINRPTPLKDRDRVRIGGYEFVFQLQKR